MTALTIDDQLLQPVRSGYCHMILAAYLMKILPEIPSAVILQMILQMLQSLLPTKEWSAAG